MENNFTGLNNSRQSSVALERINDVAAHMIVQYAEYKTSNANTTEMFRNIYENMESLADYFRQTFTARGISSDNIFCVKDEETKSALMSVLWQQIGITTILNDKPQVLFTRDGKRMNCCRILATKGDCKKIIIDNPDNYTQKLLDAELASLYIPADKNGMCEMRVRHLSNEIHTLNQQIAAKEFFLKVVEYGCGGGFYHIEKEFSAFTKP